MKKKRLVLLLTLGMAAGAVAQQKSPIRIECESFKVVTAKEMDGTVAESFDSVAKVLPGEIIEYRVTCRNDGDQAAESLKIGNPLPPELLYLEGSATRTGAELRFSVDGGKTFGAADALTVEEETGGTRLATPKEYTHIQWILADPLLPETARTVTYRVRLK